MQSLVHEAKIIITQAGTPLYATHSDMQFSAERNIAVKIKR